MRTLKASLLNELGLVGKQARRYMMSTALTATGVLAAYSPAMADNWTDHAGDGITVDTSIPNTTNITQTLDTVKIHGDGDINAGWTVNVAQPSNSSKYVLYDVENDPTYILGTLNANGQVFIFDQNGVIFGKDSVVNVGSILTSTGYISDANLAANNLTFEGVGTGGAITLNGTINVSDAGLAAFVAPTVRNNGVINAKMGKVVLASGEKVTLDLYGDDLVSIAVDDKLENALVENKGAINAHGGTVVLSAQAAGNAVDNVINMSGIVDVSSATVKGGKIILSGGKQGKVTASGVMNASGKTGGGSISVKGQTVEATNSAILVADADEQGDGGKVDVIADDKTLFSGSVYARGGVQGGNGGAVEVSGYNGLGYDGSVDTSAANGTAGSFLMDPAVAIIHSGWLDPIGWVQLVIKSENLANDMQRNGSVTVNASNSIEVGTDILFPGIGNGDINLSHYDYSVLNTHNSPFIWNWTYDHHTGDANPGNLSLVSNTVNFNKDLIMGTGNLTVDASVVNLNSKLYSSTNGGVTTTALNDAHISSNAGTVNVLSPDAWIQQGIWLANDTGATVNVGAGDYTENLLIDKGLKLTGANGAKLKYDTTNAGAGTAGNLITVTATNVGIDPFVFDGAGMANYGINATGADSLNVNGNTFQNFVQDSILLTNSDSVQIIGNTFTGGARGVVVSGDSDYADIEGLNTFNGQTVAGIAVDGTSDSSFIYNNTTNVASSGTGILISGGDSHNILNNTIDGGTRGIWFNGAGDYSTVSGNTVGQTTGTSNNGIEFLNSGSYSQIGGNHVYNAGWDGINVAGSGFTNVGGNDVHDTKGASGIAFFNHNGGGIVENNTIDNSARLGIYVGGSDGLSVIGNTITHSGTGNINGPFGPFTAGIYLEQANGTTVDNNTIDGTTGAGIQVGGGGNDAAAATSGNKITNNKIANTGGNGISVSDSASIKITGNKVGYLADGTTAAGTDNIHGDGIYVSKSSGTSGNQTEIKGNTVTETKFTVADANGSNGSGIQVVDSSYATIGGADNTTGRNTVTNSGWDGIRLQNDSNITVDNNSIDNVERVGIWGGNVNTANIKNNIVKHDNLGGYGSIHADGGSNWNVSGNDIDDGDYGIFLNGVGGAANIVDNNDVDNVTQDGVRVTNTSGLVVVNNHIGLNGYIGGNGIFIDPSNGAYISQNTVLNAALNGIYSLNNNDATIQNNTITGSGLDGILVSGGNNVLVGGPSAGYANIVKNSGDDGIDIENVTGTVQVKNNTVNTTGLNPANNEDQNGIEVSGTTGATIEANKVSHAAWDGINVQQSSGTTISNNQIFDTLGASGIGAYNGISNTTIDGNVITTAQQYGMWLGGGSDLTVTNNDISGVTQYDGIYVNGNSGTIKINSNDIYNVGRDGISANGDIDEVNSNRVLKTGRNGILVTNSANVDILSNKVGDAISSPKIKKTNGTTTSDLTTTATASNIGADGIHVENSGYADIISNTVSNTVNDGIFLDPSDYAVIAKNTINATGGDGIESADNSFVTIGGSTAADGNTITRAGAHGINVHGGSSALIQYNKVLGGNGSNSGVGASGAKLDGIHVDNNDGVDILNNTIAAGQGFSFLVFNFSGGNGADGNGVYVSSSNNATIDQNNVTGDLLGDGMGAGLDGIHVENSNLLTVGGLTPLLNGNKIVSTGYDGIYINGSTGALVLNNIIGGVPLMDVGDDGIDMQNTIGTLVAGNIITDVADDGIAFSNGLLSAIGLNVITGAGDDGIDIRSSALFAVGLNQITNAIDNGIELTGTLLGLVGWNNIDGSGNDGINTSLSALSSITNNNITNSGDDGIDASLVAALDISDNTITGANSDGIQTFLAAFSTIDGNTISDVDGNGINASWSTNLDVTNNHVDKTGLDGIRFFHADNSLVQGNLIGLNGGNIHGDGVYLDHSDHDRVLDNTIANTISPSNNKGSGVQVYFSNDALVRGNTIHDTGWDGIRVQDSADTVVRNNDIDTVVKSGVYGEHNTNMLIARNEIDNTGHNGIWVGRSDGLTIRRNRVGLNAGLGSIGSSHDGATYDNGIRVETTKNVLISNNRVDNAVGDGIHVEKATSTGGSPYSVKIDGNRVRHSGQDGIEVSGSDKVLITSNRVVDSSQVGILLSGLNNGNVVLSSNRVRDFDVGMEFQSGIIDLTGPGNTLRNGRVGLLFSAIDPAKLSLVDNDGAGSTPYVPGVLPTNYAGTIGAQRFIGQSESYVELAGGAFWDGVNNVPLWLNGLDSTYDGFRPADVGGVLTQAQYDDLEAKFRHYPDGINDGIFFFGAVPSDDEIDQSRLFRDFADFNGDITGLNIRILGLPRTNGGQGGTGLDLNNITPFAGGDANTAPGDLNNIETAAGGDQGTQNPADIEPAAGDENTSCWSDAAAYAGSGQAVNVVYNGSIADTLATAATCNTGL